MVADAVDQFIAGVDSGAIRPASGKPHKPSTIRGYRADLRQRVLPVTPSRRHELIFRIVMDGAKASSSEGADEVGIDPEAGRRVAERRPRRSSSRCSLPSADICSFAKWAEAAGSSSSRSSRSSY
jgi:hypothetical protein